MTISGLTSRIKVLRKVGKHPLDLSDHALLDVLLELDADGEEPRPDGLHEEDVLLLCERDERLGLRGIDGERLLAEDVLACVEGVFDVLLWKGRGTEARAKSARRAGVDAGALADKDGRVKRT